MGTDRADVVIVGGGIRGMAIAYGLAREGVQVVLLELFAYWPPGSYGFDNVRMCRITAAEAAAFKANRKSKYATPLTAE